MIDEAVLERALRAEAETYAVPAGGPDAIRAAAATRSVRAARRPGGRRAWWVAAAAAAAVTVGVVAVSGGGAANRFEPGMVTALSEDESGRYADEGVSGKNGGAGAGGGTGGVPVAPVAPGAQKTHVVRTGEVTVEVRDVPRAVSELARIANAYGGFVAASSSGGDPESPTGSVTVRVPTERFDAAVADASRLGKVLTSTTSGTDVSAEVTDVEARLRSLTAARGQLQTLLARARTVGEVLSVQERMTETQTQIEQLQARQRSLADKTTYGTVRVSVVVPGSAPEEPRTGFAKAWHDAVDGFVSAAQGVVAASGTIAFVLLALGLLTLLLRPLYRAWVRRLV